MDGGPGRQRGGVGRRDVPGARRQLREVLEVLMGTCEVGHGPGMRIRAALPGSGDPDPRRRQALAVLEDEACRIPF